MRTKQNSAKIICSRDFPSAVMEKKQKPETPDAFLWLKNLPPTQNAPAQFSAGELVDCPVCGRKNAPNRSNCLYCGAKISDENSAARLVLRRLENWEKGWNVVYSFSENQSFSARILAETAAFLRLESEDLERILAARKALPLARCESDEEAETVAAVLRERGFAVQIVADVNLRADALPNRVRGLEFGENELTLFLFGKDEIVSVFYDEIELFVTGAIFERQVENRERRKSSERSEIKDSREISTDETVVDFYTAETSEGFRIAERHFDFSCLGTDKRMLARENFGILLDKLKTKAASAEFDDSYKNLRQALSVVWQPDERSESLGWQREGVGKISLENRLTVSNAAQFLRYSRLQRELKAQN